MMMPAVAVAGCCDSVDSVRVPAYGEVYAPS